jgi:hypothetical protein
MGAQRAWGPVGPDHRAEIERVHLQLKRAAELYLPEFREWAIERKVRFQTLTSFVHSELRHLGSFISELVCVSFQI